MIRKEFERCLPEDVGISSGAVLELIDKLEQDYTEIHSLMILRHDKIAAEGWWSPYAPGLRHMMMSASKTFSGTAIGKTNRRNLVYLLFKATGVMMPAAAYVSQAYAYTLTIGAVSSCIYNSSIRRKSRSL